MKKKFFIKYLPYILLGLGLLVGLYRGWHFLSSQVPLGYDAGFYKLIFSVYHTVLSSWTTSGIPSWFEHEPLIGILGSLFHLGGISYDAIIIRGSLFLSILPGFILFFIFRKEHRYLAVLLALLYRTSLVQYELYYRVYLKQILGISFMLLTFHYITNKRYILSAIFFLLIMLLHRTTALYTSLALLLSIGFSVLQQKKISLKMIGVFVGAIGLGLLMYIPFRSTISGGFSMMFSGYGGDFLNKTTYIGYSFFPLLLSFRGLFMSIKKKKLDIYFWGYAVGIIWILIGLVNYNRVLGFFDIFVFIFAFRGLLSIYDYKKKLGRGIVTLLSLFLMIRYFSFVSHNSKTLISSDEFHLLQSFSTTLEPSAIIMITSKNYTPWVAGYTQRDYISPGFSALNVRDVDTWNQWRSIDGQHKCEMLKTSYAQLAGPLYLWMGSQQFVERLSGGDCFSLVQSGKRWYLYKVSLQ